MRCSGQAQRRGPLPAKAIYRRAFGPRLLRRVAPRDDACYLTPFLWALGEYGRALDTGQVALDTAKAQGDAALQVIANR
jgi:hypothetical protein